MSCPSQIRVPWAKNLVKCPGVARGMVMLGIDWHITLEQIQKYHMFRVYKSIYFLPQEQISHESFMAKKWPSRDICSVYLKNLLQMPYLAISCNKPPGSVEINSLKLWLITKDEIKVCCMKQTTEIFIIPAIVIINCWFYGSSFKGLSIVFLALWLAKVESSQKSNGMWFLDIFWRHICSTVAETIGVTNYAASFGMKKCSENHIWSCWDDSRCMEPTIN